MKLNNDIKIDKDKIKNLLKTKKSSQIKMAKAIDYNKDHLNRCLREGYVNFILLSLIAKYLGCEEESILSEDK